MSSPTPPGETPATRRQLSSRRMRFFVLASLVLILVLQEVACRWLFPLPECDDFNRINYTPLAVYGEALTARRHEGLSNIKLVWESEPDGFSFVHTLNLYGFRGPDFSIDKSGGQPRVVFVGDSYTEGAGAADDQTLPEQFRQLTGAEVINLGVSGTGFPEYVRLVRDGVALLKPDALFLVVCHNDLPTESALEPLKPPPEFSRLNPWTPRALAALTRKREGRSLPSRFFSGPFPFLAPVPSPANPLSYNPPLKNVDPVILDAMKRGKCNAAALAQAGTHERVLRYDYSQGSGSGPFLDYIAKRCKEANTKLIVMFIPAPMTANPLYMADQLRLGAPSYGKVTRLDGPEYRAAQRNLSEVSGKLGVPFLDMTDELIEAEKTGRMYWSIDTHCTPAGYRLLAEVCARYWTDKAMPRTESP